jgi:hypothetical protein
MKSKEMNDKLNSFIVLVLLAYFLFGVIILLTSCNKPTGTEQYETTKETIIEQAPIECSRYTLVWEPTSEQLDIYIGSFAEPTGQSLNDILKGGYDYLLIAGNDLRYEENIGLVEWQQCPQYK